MPTPGPWFTQHGALICEWDGTERRRTSGNVIAAWAFKMGTTWQWSVFDPNGQRFTFGESRSEHLVEADTHSPLRRAAEVNRIAPPKAGTSSVWDRLIKDD